MILMNNVFQRNTAINGGGGIYFNDALLNESPYKYNTFHQNEAFFANDFYTFPVRLQFQDENNFKSWKNKSMYVMTIIPGMSEFNIFFDVIDYYGQILKLINGLVLFYFSTKFIFIFLQFYSVATKKLKI